MCRNPPRSCHDFGIWLDKQMDYTHKSQCPERQRSGVLKIFPGQIIGGEGASGCKDKKGTSRQMGLGWTSGSAYMAQISQP